MKKRIHKCWRIAFVGLLSVVMCTACQKQPQSTAEQQEQTNQPNQLNQPNQPNQPDQTCKTVLSIEREGNQILCYYDLKDETEAPISGLAFELQYDADALEFSGVELADSIKEHVIMDDVNDTETGVVKSAYLFDAGIAQTEQFICYTFTLKNSEQEPEDINDKLNLIVYDVVYEDENNN